MRVRRVALVAGIGTAVTLLTAAVLSRTLREAFVLAGVSAGAALGVGALGAGALFLLRRRSIASQTTLVALTTVAAVVAGAGAASRVTFLGWETTMALIVVVMAAGTVGVLTAQALGLQIGTASRALGWAANRIGRGDFRVKMEEPRTEEFAQLARELERMSQRLEEARARERALDSSRRELVAWVSHDLRTPLARIRAISEALDDRVVEDAETLARYYRTLRLEADRLTGIVDDLFELNRINAGALRLILERASLGDVVSDAVAAADISARGKRISLEARPPTVDLAVDLSIPHIARALHNLLENAIRHTAEGSVGVELGREGDQAFVAIVDACGGIPAESLAGLLEARPGGTSRPGEGTGFGIAIARGIAEAHGGTITAENTRIGCRFVLRLPLPAGS